MAWYDTVDREAVFAVMRRWDETAMMFNRMHRRNAPRHGEIAAGGAHMDSWFAYEAIMGFLSALRKGLDPEQARDAGKAAGVYSVELWNQKRARDPVVHRNVNTADAYVERAYLEVTAAAGAQGPAPTMGGTHCRGDGGRFTCNAACGLPAAKPVRSCKRNG